MRFTCEKALLQGVVSTASRAVAAKSPNLALEGLLIEADESLCLTGYDLRTGIRAICPAQVRETGRTVVSSRLFGDIIRRLPDEMVQISTQNDDITIRCGMTEFHIIALDPEQFPALPGVDHQNVITLPQRTLMDMLNQTLFSVSHDESRPVHTGILFELDDQHLLTLVAVDGYRLALRRESVSSGEPCSFVAPASALNEVARICADTDDPIEIVQGSSHILFRAGNVTLITRCLEGEFLRYRQSIPLNQPIHVIVDRRQLIRSIERCSLVVTEQQKSPLRCLFEGNLLRLKTATALGTAYDECPVVSSGEELEIGFNNKYVLDALKAAPADSLLLQLNSPVSPCVIVPVEEDDQSFLYMVLPVRLRAG